MAKAPLSKYGLRARISSLSLGNGAAAELRRRGLASDSLLNLYANGRTYSTSGQVTTRRFLTSLSEGPMHKKGKVPPIASNIKVKVPTKGLP